MTQKEPVICDNCRKEIKDMYYYIGDNAFWSISWWIVDS